MSVLLVASILASFPVLNIFVSIAEDNGSSGGEEAEAGEIYAYLKLIDPNKAAKNNLELIFTNENVQDPNCYAGPWTDFAETEYVQTTYKNDGTGRPAVTWGDYQQWKPDQTPDQARLPWSKAAANSSKGAYIRKVTFRDKIAPRSIAGWFYNMKYRDSAFSFFD
jgi:hypothetical protein